MQRGWDVLTVGGESFSNGMRPDWKGGGAVATGNGAGRDPRNPAKPFYNRCLFWKETFVQEAAAVQNKRL